MMSFVLLIFIILAVDALIFFIITSRSQAEKSDEAAEAALDLRIENVRAFISDNWTVSAPNLSLQTTLIVGSSRPDRTLTS